MPGIFSNPFSTNPQPSYTVGSSGDVIKTQPQPFYKQPGFWGGIGGSFTPLGSLGGKLAGTILGKATGLGQPTQTNLGPVMNAMGFPAPEVYNVGGGGWMNGSMLGGFNLPAPTSQPNYTGDPLSLIVSQAPLSPGTYPMPNYTGGPVGGSELEQSIMQGLGQMEFDPGASAQGSGGSYTNTAFKWGAQPFAGWGDVMNYDPYSDQKWMEDKATNIVHNNVG